MPYDTGSFLEREVQKANIDMEDGPVEVRIPVYRDALKSIRDFLLFSDFRNFGESTLDLLQNDLVLITRGIHTISASSPIWLPTTEPILRNLQLARQEIYVASDMLREDRSERNRRSFYTSLLECQQYVALALGYLA